MFAVKFAVVSCARRTWMGQGDRSRTNRPKEAAVSDEAKKKALLDFWEIMWRKEKTVIVFANTEEACDAGLPTLVTMNELARRVTGCEIVHFGFGCFGAKTFRDGEIFSFCGGGAMHQSEALACSYTILGIPNAKHRRLVMKLMREICPKAFAYVDQAKAQRKAERMQEAEEAEETDMIVSGIDREIYEAALEVLKDMDTIGASEEASVVRLQRAVDAVKALKS